MINGINHVALATSDLDRLVAFYRDVLGFRVCTGFEWKNSALVDGIIGVTDSAGKSAVLAAGNVYIEIFQYTHPRTGQRGPLHQPFDRGYTHICFDVTNIDEESVRLAAAGAIFNQPPPYPQMSGLKSIYGRDPDGNIIEIQETLDNSYGMSLCDLPLVKIAPPSDRELK